MAETYRTLDRSEASLGKQLSTHVRLPRVGPVPVLLCAVAAGMLWLKAASHPRLALAAWIMTALAAAAGIGFAFDVARRRLWSSVSVFEHGLLLHRATGSRVLAWDDITSLELRREKRMRAEPASFVPLPGLVVVSAETEWHWICRVRAEGRVVVELSEQFAGSTALLETLRRETEARAVPRILEEIRDGGRVSIGPIAITEAHLEVRDTPVPWSEIGQVFVHGASLLVHDHEDVERARALVEHVPNVHVVIAVAEQLTLQHRA